MEEPPEGRRDETAPLTAKPKRLSKPKRVHLPTTEFKQPNKKPCDTAATLYVYEETSGAAVST